tara:strand:- start:2668 stop:3084 length:417 start_codon:yes stop_codon:yes gene_type:complete
MNENKIKQIITYLSKLGQVRFYNFDFDLEQGPFYASMEFITDIEMATGLEKTINETVSSLENNNPSAKIRFIGISEQPGKKIRYDVEIVPNSKNGKPMTKEYMIKATERFLTVLPKAFKNIRQKQIDYRKVGEEELDS